MSGGDYNIKMTDMYTQVLLIRHFHQIFSHIVTCIFNIYMTSLIFHYL
jgi:hypothetical protein